MRSSTAQASPPGPRAARPCLRESSVNPRALYLDLPRILFSISGFGAQPRRAVACAPGCVTDGAAP